MKEKNNTAEIQAEKISGIETILSIIFHLSLLTMLATDFIPGTVSDILHSTSLMIGGVAAFARVAWLICSSVKNKRNV